MVPRQMQYNAINISAEIVSHAYFRINSENNKTNGVIVSSKITPAFLFLIKKGIPVDNRRK
jgi:hypothetical protein